MENKYKINDDYAELIINSPKYGIFNFQIDLDDLEKVKSMHWALHVVRFKSKTAIRYYAADSKNHMLLHRFIMDNPKETVDHIDQNTFNTRKYNLRECTILENCRNQKKPTNNKSGHKGVLWYHYQNVNKWMAYIKVDYKFINLGYYEDINDAINARKEADIKYFGEFKSSI